MSDSLLETKRLAPPEPYYIQLKNATRKTEKQKTPTPEQAKSIPALGAPQLSVQVYRV
jgi:hypothetical protein